MNRTTARERIVALWTDVLYAPSVPRAGNPAILCAHGALSLAVSSGLEPVVQPLVARGYTALIHDLGGGATWDNDDSRDAFDACVDWLEERGHERIYLLGASMGAMGVLGWARANPSRYRAASLIVPAVNAQWIYDNTAFAGSMDTAHGGSWAAVQADRDPWPNASAYTSHELQVWYSLNDTVVGANNPPQWCDDAGVRPISQGSVGHTVSGVDSDEILRFFESH